MCRAGWPGTRVLQAFPQVRQELLQKEPQEAANFLPYCWKTSLRKSAPATVVVRNIDKASLSSILFFYSLIAVSSYFVFTSESSKRFYSVHFFYDLIRTMCFPLLMLISRLKSLHFFLLTTLSPSKTLKFLLETKTKQSCPRLL